MKFIIVFALVIVAVAARPQQASETVPATILKDDNDVRADGYNFAIETSDGIKREETGELKASGTDTVLNVMGSYSYTAPDGQVINVHYIADQNGFQPDNVPKA